MEMGFSPISDDLVGDHERGSPAVRTPPRGAESPPKLVRPVPPPVNNSMMTVPHIGRFTHLTKLGVFLYY